MTKINHQLLLFCASFFLLSCNNTGASIPAQSTPLSVIPHTLAEVKQHSTASNCWMSIESKVYDVTSYIASGQHVPKIVEGCGKNATAMFAEERKHTGSKSQKLLEEFYIGPLQ